MAEAQKMMENPEWKKRMKEVTKDPSFKESVKKTKDLLDDPNAAAKAEAKFEHMHKIGAERLKQKAANEMEQAMAALANPEVMEEMARMLKDPKFKEQLDAMASDPQFKNYMEAMSTMMQDPAKKAKIQAVKESVKANL